MAHSWTNVVGSPVIAALAKECSIQLTPDLIRFLDLYSEQLQAAGRSRAVNRRTAARQRQELREVIDVVQAEVKDFRDAHQEHGPEIEQLTVARQRETYIPVVHCKLRSLPTMVVHVRRTYATQRILAGISWKLSECKSGSPTGKARNAMNYVRTYSRGRRHQVTLYDILKVWVASGLGIPREEREGTANVPQADLIRHPNSRGKRGNAKMNNDQMGSDTDRSNDPYQTSSATRPMNRARKRDLANFLGNDDQNSKVEPRRKLIGQAHPKGLQS
eukprot:GFKZ01011341.1.p1 GENE.GFKZ01011341.1~~GFKZ01011341.1.p1  ORF type:complete len:274 (-),score=20.29 GFKZ01011341.1:1022-1843(-)